MATDNTLPPGYVVPNPGPPKMIGILNIVFSSLILMVALCMTITTLATPIIAKWMQGLQKQQEQQAAALQKQAIDAQLADLDMREKAAATEPEKEEIKAEREALKSRPKPLAVNVMAGMELTRDPRMQTFTWIDLVTALLLNVPMLISGIWLIRLRESGRRLAIGIAWAKILRSIALAIYCVTVIVPMMTTLAIKQFDTMGAQIQASQGNRGGGPPVRQTLNQMGGFMGVAYTAMYVGIYSMYLIYPGISIWVLTRPRSKAACIAAQKAEPDYLA